MRISRTVLRAALGETPEAYSLGQNDSLSRGTDLLCGTLVVAVGQLRSRQL